MQPRIVPHPRTLRNAREQVKQMVASGLSSLRAMSYLSQWVSWWAQTAKSWTKHELLTWFIDTCWDESAKEVASMLLLRLDGAHAALANTDHSYVNQALVLVQAQ